MVKNYITENIAHLVDKSGETQDDFGSLFDLKRGAINSYINQKALPKIETIQRICLHYEITIDDFVNRELATIEQDRKTSFVNEPAEGYGIVDVKYIELLEKSNSDKDKLIKTYEERLGINSEKSDSA